MRKNNSTFALILILLLAGALSAQTVSVDKSSLTFFAGAGGTVQTTTLTVSANGSSGFIAQSNQLWLKLNGQTVASGSTLPATLNVTADPTGLAAAQYSGNIAVQGLSGPAINVGVTFTVGTIGVDHTTLTFAYQSSGTVPAPQNLGVSATQSIGYAAAASTATGGNWLAVSPSNGTAPATVQASLNGAVVTGLAAGTYNGTITLTPASGPAVTVAVTLTVTAAPNVTVSPGTVNLNYQIGGATGSTNTPAQAVTITNPGNQDLSYLLASSSTPNWITLTPTSGTAPANGSTQFTIGYLTTAALQPGTYNGTVTVFVPGAANSQLSVKVNLLVSTSPLLTVPGATLAFTYEIGASAPASQSVLATSTQASGTMPLVLSASTSTGGSWLTVPQTAQTGTAFSVSVNPSGLPPGTYQGTVSINGVGAANNPQSVPVTLTVSNDPLVVASFGGCSTLNTSCPMNFPIQGGQNSPTSQTVTIASSTGAAITFTATAATTSCGNWLSVGATASAGTSFPVLVNPSGITPEKTCAGTITIAATNPANGNTLPNSPVTIPVTMYVSANPMLITNPIALNFTVSSSAATNPQQSITVTSTGADMGFTASSNQTTAPWLLVGPNARNTAAGSNTVSAVVVASSLPPGTYTSQITLTATPAGVLDSPLAVPVTLTVTSATMSVTPASLTFNQTLGAAAPAAKTLAVSTNSTDIAFATSVVMVNGSNWLTVSPASATATSANPASVSVSVNGSNLAAGTYNGNITITAITAGTAGSPVSIPVQLVVAPGTLAVDKTTLAFAQVAGGPPPAAQTINVTATPSPLNFTVTPATTSGGGWLSASTGTGTTNQAVQISVNGGSLAIGTYNGTVTIASTGATGSPQVVNVTLTVTQSQSVVVAPAALNFSYTIGATTTPQAQTVQLTASGGAAQFTTAATTTSGGAWLSVTPASGTTPSTLTIAVSVSGLTTGNYTGTVAINSPSSSSQPAASVTVNLAISSVPKPVPAAIQNAASAAVGAVSPGENIVIYGTGLGPATLAPAHLTNGVFDTSVGGTRVLFDGVPAPIIYARTDQTSVMVPYFVARGPSTSLVVEFQGVQSTAVVLSVAATAPGIYTLNQQGSGQGAILSYDLSGNPTGVNAAANPSVRGSVIAVYMTGEGTAPGSIDGAVAAINGNGLFKPLAAVSATIGGMPATVAYYGSAPDIVYGVMQVNLVVPANVQPGPAVPIQITVGSTTTQSGVTLAVN